MWATQHGLEVYEGTGLVKKFDDYVRPMWFPSPQPEPVPPRNPDTPLFPDDEDIGDNVDPDEEKVLAHVRAKGSIVNSTVQ
jgi:hypothetical protein